MCAGGRLGRRVCRQPAVGAQASRANKHTALRAIPDGSSVVAPALLHCARRAVQSRLQSDGDGLLAFVARLHPAKGSKLYQESDDHSRPAALCKAWRSFAKMTRGRTQAQTERKGFHDRSS